MIMPRERMARNPLPKFLPNALAKRIKYALVPDECSHVRHLTGRNGEVLNLSNKEHQRKSLAALLAKKNWTERSRLSQLYSISKTRELSMQECSEIFRICSWKHGGIDE